MEGLSNDDKYMNFNLYTVDVPSVEDCPWSLGIGSDYKNNVNCI